MAEEEKRPALGECGKRGGGWMLRRLRNDKAVSRGGASRWRTPATPHSEPRSRSKFYQSTYLAASFHTYLQIGRQYARNASVIHVAASGDRWAANCVDHIACK